LAPGGTGTSSNWAKLGGVPDAPSVGLLLTDSGVVRSQALNRIALPKIRVRKTPRTGLAQHCERNVRQPTIFASSLKTSGALYHGETAEKAGVIRGGPPAVNRFSYPIAKIFPVE
jgi:hypothetical protein